MNIITALRPFYSRRLILSTLLVSGFLHWALLQWPTTFALAGQPDGETRYKVSLRHANIAQSKTTSEKLHSDKKSTVKVKEKKVVEKRQDEPRQVVEKKKTEPLTVAENKQEQSEDIRNIEVEKNTAETKASEVERSIVSSSSPAYKNVPKQSESTQLESGVPKHVSVPDLPVAEEAVAAKNDDNDQQADDITEEKVAETVPQETDIEPAKYEIGSASNPKPYYPAIARKRGWEGDVVLGVNVAADGSIESLIIIQGASYSALTHAAWETVKDEWSFKAAMKEGQAIASYIEVPISFRLTN